MTAPTRTAPTRTAPRRPDTVQAGTGEDREVRTAILAATRELLAGHRYDEVAVADVLGTARVSRASFYFYFAGKAAVLTELARDALAGLPDAGPGAADRTVAAEIAAHADAWRVHGPVLAALAGNWRTDQALTAVWNAYTTATAGRLGAALGEPDADLAAGLAWTGLHAFHLGALGVAPFADPDRLAVLVARLWSAPARPAPQGRPEAKKPGKSGKAAARDAKPVKAAKETKAAGKKSKRR